MNDSQGVIEVGIVTALSAHAPGVAFYGSRIYALEAPQDAVRPYILITHVGGGDRNLQPTRMIDPRFLVECVADTLSQARTGSGHVEAVLTGTALTLLGWNWMATHRQDSFQRVERMNNVARYRRGHYFKIMAVEAA